MGFQAKSSFIAGVMFVLVGCGDPNGPAPSASATPSESLVNARNYTVDGSANQGDNALAAPISPAPGEFQTRTKGAAEDTKVPDASKPATEGRKIIYNARIELVTEDLNPLEATLTKLIAAQKAYVADSERRGSAGSTRMGIWKVRVPVDGYDAFVRGVVALGELVSMKADSQDVSEEFFDLDARQTAKKVEEARLLKHLTDSTGKLEEILAVERELSRVRSEIERMQGRLRLLGNLSALATVTITVSEIKGYVPPQAPTLGTRLSRTFAASLEALQHFGEAVLIAIVAIAPWLPLIAVAVGVMYLIGRRLAARELPAAAQVEAVERFLPPPPLRP
jgi:hypothetical protein